MFRLLTATRRNCWWSLQESSEVKKKKHNVSLSSKLFYDVLDRNADRPEPTQAWHRLFLLFQGRNNSVGVALDCRAGGRGLDPRSRTYTQGRKITEKRRYCVALQTAIPWGAWMTTLNGDSVSVADVNLVSLISTSFVLFFLLILTFDIIILF